jgi:serine protease Do
MAGALGVKADRGVLVGEVVEGGPAAKAGLARGDVIVELDGQPVTDTRTFRMRVAERSPGSPARLVVLRKDARREITAALGELPDERRPSPPPIGRSEKFGMRVVPLSEGIARQLDLRPGTRGVAVTAVQPGSPAADAGLRPGDVILEADRAPMGSPDDLRQALEKHGAGPVLLLVLRDGHTRYVAVEPPER